MYCPRCRIKTEDEFCENCGNATVSSEEVAATTVQADMHYLMHKEIKKEKVITRAPKLTIKKIISLVAILVIGTGALIGYSLLKKQYTPKKTVEKYYNYLSNHDYDNAYKMLINTDDKFLSKDIYKNSMSKMNFNEFTIQNYNEFSKSYLPNNSQDTNISNSGNMFSVQAGGKSYPVSVVNMGKRLLIFNNYKIAADNYTIKWQFTAPTGAKILINGKEPIKTNEPNLDNAFSFNGVYKPSSAVYEIGRIFNGTYDVTATMEGAKEVNYKGLLAGKKINIVFEPNDDLTKQLKENAKSFLELYYSNASQDKYSNLVTTDSNALKRIKEFAMYRSDKAVNKIKSVEVTEQSIDDVEHAKITVKSTIDYEDSSIAIWGLQKQVGTKEKLTDFYFEKQNGKWLIVDTGYFQ